MAACSVLFVVWLLAATPSADATCPGTFTWRQTEYVLTRTDSRPGPPIYGRKLARSVALNLRCVYIRSDYDVAVWAYALPGVDPTVAIRIEGPTFNWAIYVRRGWRIKPNTPLWRVIHHS